ncbi:MAG: hypothetical protein IJT64_00100 [Kiritimatiellae bacterium]|nr:hypothetical protein [Kiritimatiellia bacterium]
MFTLIISAALGVALAASLKATHTSAIGWAIAFGLLLFFAVNTAIGLSLKNRIKALMDRVQGILQSGQRQVQEKTNAWRFRPPGSPKQAQIELQKMQHALIEKALAESEAFNPYFNWVPLLRRQIATMRMQLHYQDRNWSEVDKLMPQCLFLEPLTMSMRLARMYVVGGKDEKSRAEMEKFFGKCAKRLRYGQGAILYALHAWTKVQDGDLDGAVATLNAATKKMENETIKRNLELLLNGKPKHFNLSGLGDEWYALALEEPRIKTQRQHQRPF